MRTCTEQPAPHRLLQEVVRLLQTEPQYRSFVLRVLATERHYSKQAVGASERRIMRFLTAKMLFIAAIDMGAAFRTVKRRFREVLSLSDGELHSDVAAHIEFAEYFRCQGQVGIGIQRLECLQANLNRLEGSAAKRLLANCRDEIAKMLLRLCKEQVGESGHSPKSG